jgi:hypothetical protein
MVGVAASGLVTSLIWIVGSMANVKVAPEAVWSLAIAIMFLALT